MQRDNTPDWPIVALIGCYPPPFGGISVQLQRLSDYLEQAGVEHTVYNTASLAEDPPRILSVVAHRRWWYAKFLATHRCRIVHLLLVDWAACVLFAIAATFRPGKYVLSIPGRNISQPLKSTIPGIAPLTRWMLRQMDTIIASNSDIARDCIGLGGISPERVCIIPAFIPPATAKPSSIPEYIREYMSQHSPLLSAVGWIGETYEGVDLYGLDMMMTLVKRLKGDHPRIGLIISVNGGPENEVRETIRRARHAAGDSILLVKESLSEFTPVAQQSALFLRPTNTDGDAVSIREALYVGTPVIASNAVPRPSPCVLFINRDIDDFEYHVREALGDQEALKSRIAEYSVADNAESMLLVYERLIRGEQYGSSE